MSASGSGLPAGGSAGKFDVVKVSCTIVVGFSGFVLCVCHELAAMALTAASVSLLCTHTAQFFGYRLCSTRCARCLATRPSVPIKKRPFVMGCKATMCL